MRAVARLDRDPHTLASVSRSRLFEACKRAVDIIGAIAALVLLAPLLVAISVLIKIQTPGPVFYRGVRIGRHGKEFRIFKFRTMVVDAENRGGTTTALADDRVTPPGHFLRKNKIDELPQFLNVLVGDMSLVGPRPEVGEYANNYTEDERVILAVRPGITDFASLQFVDLAAHVGHLAADEAYRKNILPEKNRLRIKYVRERSPGLDLKILVKTTWTVCSRLCMACFTRRK